MRPVDDSLGAYRPGCDRQLLIWCGDVPLADDWQLMAADCRRSRTSTFASQRAAEGTADAAKGPHAVAENQSSTRHRELLERS